MRKLMYLFAPLALAGTLLAADPFSGTWKLDRSQSTGDAIPQDETIKIVDAGGVLHVTVTGTDSDGKPIAVTYVVPVTGGDAQETQGPYNVSEQRIDDNTRDVTYEKNGNKSKHHRVVSKDGKSMKPTNKGKDAQGNTVNSTEVYRKLDDTQAFRK